MIASDQGAGAAGIGRNTSSAVLDMFERLHGTWRKPFVLPRQSVSPLVVNEGTADKLKVSPSGTGWSSIPTTAWPGPRRPNAGRHAGSVAGQTLLAGLTISQLIRPGAPTALGMLPVYFDMNNDELLRPTEHPHQSGLRRDDGLYGLPTRVRRAAARVLGSMV